MAPASGSKWELRARVASYLGVSAVIIGACVALEKHPMIVGLACVLAASVCGFLLLDSLMLKQKRMDDALRGNAEWYLNLFESALNAVVIIDGETHRVEDVNTAALRLYGYTKEEFLRLRVEDISAEPERTRVSLDQTVAGTARGTIPLIQHKKKSGQSFPVEIATSVCAIEGRKKAVGIIRDLTESLEQEREIKRSEKRYRSLFENSHDALMTTEFPGLLFSSANAATVAMFRAKNEGEFLMRTPGELSPEFQPDGRSSKEKAQELMSATLFEGCQHFEWIHKRFDGEEFPADVLLTRTELDGKIFIQATVRDLTEAHRTREERDLLSTAIEQTSEGVVITDAAARIIYVNPAFERVTGYSRAEAQGKKTSLLKSGHHDASFYKDMWATLARGEVWRGHLFNRRKDGTIYEEDSSIAPVRGSDGSVTHFIAVKRDISKERNLEAQFLHAQKMEGIGRLAGGVAHDFNNLLTAISGYSYFLLNEMKPDNPQRADVQEIVKAGERAAALTRQLLAFSRQQVLQPRVLDPNLLVSEFEKMLRRLIGEDIALKLVLSESVGAIKADPGQIEQVVMNLVVNARDAMSHGGTITIETKNMEVGSADPGIHSSVHPGSYVLLRVGDDGCGMDAKTLARIFEPFFTTKEQGKGTGLGLSTVYGIVKQSGGYIFAESELGRGTHFNIYLPRVTEVIEGSAAKSEPLRSAGGKETILLVEDDEMVRTLVRRVLTESGYNLLEASGPAEAIRLCENKKKPIDLLLTDIVMPGMRGDEMADILAPMRPEMKVVFTSGYTEAGVLRGTVADSGSTFIQKPIDPAVLMRTVREALDGARPAKI